jgi:hypothetical protein
MKINTHENKARVQTLLWTRSAEKMKPRNSESAERMPIGRAFACRRLSGFRAFLVSCPIGPMVLWCIAIGSVWAVAAEPPALTSLSNPAIRYRVPDKPYVVLKRADVEAVVADNRPVDDAILPQHRAGYSGIASLKHAQRRENLFVPLFSGLNYEHIHDGTFQSWDVFFEPRRASMELRVVDSATAELYQKSTPTYGLESCHRYHLLENGTIEMIVEYVPRQRSFKHGYFGVFYACYIHQPESLDIHFKGYPDNQPRAGQWVRGVSTVHGIKCTHPASDDRREFPDDPRRPLTLPINLSGYRYTEPWYYGVSHGMALLLVFRAKDQIRLAQSPCGAGTGNPAWDFNYLVRDYEVGKRYQMVMRAMYLPYQSPEQIERAAQSHLKVLNAQ